MVTLSLSTSFLAVSRSRRIHSCVAAGLVRRNGDASMGLCKRGGKNNLQRTPRCYELHGARATRGQEGNEDTQRQGHEAQEHEGTGKRGHQSTRKQDHWNTGALDHHTTAPPQHENTRISEHVDTRRGLLTLHSGWKRRVVRTNVAFNTNNTNPRRHRLFSSNGVSRLHKNRQNWTKGRRCQG